MKKVILIQKLKNMLIHYSQKQKMDIVIRHVKKIHSIFLNSTSTNNKTNKCYLLNSNDILLAPNSNILIEKRQNAASELNKKCRWINNEISLLLKLKKDLKGNITLINEYFLKRTYKSIEHKLSSIENKKSGNHNQ